MSLGVQLRVQRLHLGAHLGGTEDVRTNQRQTENTNVHVEDTYAWYSCIR